jgi:hypothetical protein
MEASRFMPIVVPHRVRIGSGDERRQSPQEVVERLEHQAGGPLRMGPGAAQMTEDAAVLTQSQAVLGEGGSQAAAAETFQGLAVLGGHGPGGME